MIVVSDVCKTIKGKSVLSNICYTFECGHVYGIRGANGSGKTMLLRVLSGLMKPTNGSVIVDGKRLWYDISFPASIGVLIENPAFLDEFSGYENLKLLADLNNLNFEHIQKVIDMTGLSPNAMKKYKKYSLGMKQRLGLAAAIIGFPDIVLLDEPTNALDSNGITLLKSIIAMLSDDKRIIIISSHEQSIIDALCTDHIIMEEGKMVETEK